MTLIPATGRGRETNVTFLPYPIVSRCCSIPNFVLTTVNDKQNENHSSQVQEFLMLPSRKESLRRPFGRWQKIGLSYKKVKITKNKKDKWVHNPPREGKGAHRNPFCVPCAAAGWVASFQPHRYRDLVGASWKGSPSLESSTQRISAAFAFENHAVNPIIWTRKALAEMNRVFGTDGAE